MKPKIHLSLIFTLILCVLTIDMFAQSGYWPPNEGRRSSAGSNGSRSASFTLPPGMSVAPDSFPVIFRPIDNLNQLRKAQTAWNFRGGLNFEAGDSDQSLGDNFGRNLQFSVSFSRRALTLTRLDEFINILGDRVDIEPPTDTFVLIEQTRYYYEPELTYSSISFDRGNESFQSIYLELFPLVFKYNLGRNISIGAGAGLNAALNIQQNGQTIDNPGDNGFQPVGILGLVNASIYTNSPFHIELRYVFRPTEYAGENFQLSTFQTSVAYSLGDSNPIKRIFRDKSN